MIGNVLDKNIFENNIDFELFQDILNKLDHVIPQKISRQEYLSRNGDILVESGEDDLGKIYKLYLPKDLKIGECLYLINFLQEKFEIQNYIKFDELIIQTKIMVGIICKTHNFSQEILQQLAIKYNIPNDFIDKILNFKLKFSTSRQIIKKLKKQRENNDFETTLGKNEDDLLIIENQLSKDISKEFDFVFFEKGINFLRNSLKTITGQEQEKKIKALERKGYKKFFNNDGTITYEKGKNIIVINIDSKDLDKEQRLLRDKIGIDEFKKKLNISRSSGDKEKTQKLELQATQKILTVLYEYMYQLTQNDYGYQPKNIVKYKEIYCVGYMLTGYAFLSELKIKHYGINIPPDIKNGKEENNSHIAIKIDIGEKQYYFDPTLSDKLYSFKTGEKNGEYIKIYLEDDLFSDKFFANFGEIREVAFLGILNNLGFNLSGKTKFKTKLKNKQKNILKVQKIVKKGINIKKNFQNYYILAISLLSLFELSNNIEEKINFLKEGIFVLEEAILIYKAPIFLKTKGDALYELSLLENNNYLKEKLLKEALKDFEKAIFLACNSGEYYIKAGHMIYEIGILKTDLEEKKELFLKALNIVQHGVNLDNSNFFGKKLENNILQKLKEIEFG